MSSLFGTTVVNGDDYAWQIVLKDSGNSIVGQLTIFLPGGKGGSFDQDAVIAAAADGIVAAGITGVAHAEASRQDISLTAL